jgi:hypothetical protein
VAVGCGRLALFLHCLELFHGSTADSVILGFNLVNRIGGAWLYIS